LCLAVEIAGSLIDMKKKIFYGWYIVAATNIICMLGFGTWLYSFGTLFKPITNEFGWSRMQTSAASSFRSIEGGLIAPAIGWAVDKYGARIVIFIGGVLSGLGFVMMSRINSLVAFYVAYSIVISIGMSAMLYMPAFAVLANWFIRKRSRAFSLLAVGAGIGGLVCAPATAELIIRIGWRATCLAIGLTIWAVVLPLSFIVKTRPEDEGLMPDGDPPPVKREREGASDSVDELPPASAEVEWTLGQAMKTRTYWILATAFFFTSMAHGMIITHAIPSLEDIGMHPTRAAFLGMGLVTLLSIIGRLVFGMLGDFVVKRYLLMVSYSLCGLGLFALMNVHDEPSAWLYAALYGIGFGAGIPVRPALRGEYFGRKSFAKIQGFMAPITMLGSMAGPVIAGRVYDVYQSYDASFFVTGLLQFLGAGIIFFARPARHPGETGTQFAEP
jgi:MFS family permease